MTQTADILTGASVLVATGFTQNVLARTVSGEPCRILDPAAASFSVVGAVDRAALDCQRASGVFVSDDAINEDRARAYRAIAAQIPDDDIDNCILPEVDVVRWTNAAGRTAEDVCAVLNAAADAARTGAA